MLKRRNKTGYKLNPADKFTRMWKKAKTDFFKVADKKKPKVTKEVTVFGQKMTYQSRSTGLESSLSKIEKLIPLAYASPAKRNQMIAARDKYDLQVVRFMKSLNAIIDNAPEDIDATPLQRASRKLASDLVVIKRDLLKEDNKLKNFLGESQAFKTMGENLAKNIRKNTVSAREFIEDVRSNPTPEAFNKDVESVARHITQQIGNIDKLVEMGYEFRAQQPDEMFDLLSPWANDGRKVARDGDANAVNAEVNAFEEVIERLEEWVETI